MNAKKEIRFVLNGPDEEFVPVSSILASVAQILQKDGNKYRIGEFHVT